MKQISIGFSKPNKWKPYSWLIMTAYNIPYDHVYIKLHSDTYERDLIYQASGFSVNFMGSNLFNSNNVVVKEFPIEISDDSYKKMMQFAIDNAGKPYGILRALGLGIIKIASWFGKTINNPFADGQSSWICDEIAAYILINFDGATINKDLDNLTPKDLYDWLVANNK